jgi:hypothetical protein
MRRLLVLLLLVVGCGPHTGTVSGSVTFNGATVSDGTVSFITAGKVFSTEIRDGKYEVAGVPPGPAKVTVVRLDANQPDPYEALNKVRKEMVLKKVADPKQIDPKIVTDPAQLEALARKQHLLPLSYASAATTDLQLEVIAGPNTYPIELKGKIPN